MKDLISIVVPVYNVEKYLKKCVDSLINQTYKNIEIILVDDGSTDNSGALCDEYKKIDKRISVYHKKNGGLSDARNYGIDKAKGKYIGFIDSDDFVTKDMYERLYKAIKKHDADVAMGRIIDCYDKIPSIENSNSNEELLTPEDAIKKIMGGEEVGVHAVTKLYKKHIFSNGLRFEVGRTIEDAILMIELYSKCKKIVYVPAYVYYYIHRENSITTKKFNERNYDIIYAYEKNYDLIKKKYPQLLDIAKMRLCWANFQVLDSMVKSDLPLDDKLVNYLRSNFMFIMRCRYFTKGRKVSMIALRISKKLYVKIAKKFYLKKRRIYE